MDMVSVNSIIIMTTIFCVLIETYAILEVLKQTKEKKQQCKP